MTKSSEPATPLHRLLFSADEPRLRAGWRLLIHFLLLVFFIFLFALPIFGFLAPGGQLDDDSVLLANALSLALPITAATYVARRWIDRRSFASLGLVLNRQGLADLLFGILLTGIQMGFIFLSFWVLGWLDIQSFAWQAMPAGQILQGTLYSLFVFIWVGWGEELLARGYWLQNLAGGLNMTWGVLLSSVLFALGHSFNPNVTWVAVLGLFLAGLFFAYLYLRTRLLWLPIGAHIGWNFFEGTVFGFPVSGLDISPLVEHRVTGPEIITGGAFGPEAGLILLPALALGAVLVYLYTRKRALEISDQESRTADL